MAVKVYRYENSKGIGPYQCHDEIKALKQMYRHHGFLSCYHATIDQDFNFPVFNNSDSFIYNRGVNPEFYFGCSSKSKLLMWFRGFNWILEKNGFHIVEYEIDVERIIFSKSGKQIAFRKQECTNRKVIK